MGQINLFAFTLSETMRDFLAVYKDGALQPIAMVRVLEPTEEGESPRPRCHLNMGKLDFSYILVEIAHPLTWDDANWLYRAIIGDDEGMGKNEFKKSCMRYAVERALTKPGDKRKRTKVNPDNQEAEWEIVNNFRRQLELPAMAFRHYKDTAIEQGHINVKREGDVLVIEYAAKPQVRRRSPETDEQ